MEEQSNGNNGSHRTDAAGAEGTASTYVLRPRCGDRLPSISKGNGTEWDGVGRSSADKQD